MNSRRWVSVVLALAATAVLVTGSIGYTSVSADRSVSVSVVDAEDAYVQVSVCERATKQNRSGSSPVNVTVANKYSEPFNVTTISWNDQAHPNKTEVTPDVELSPGESETFANTFADEQVTVEVSGGLDATVTVEVGPQCSANRSKSQ